MTPQTRRGTGRGTAGNGNGNPPDAPEDDRPDGDPDSRQEPAPLVPNLDPPLPGQPLQFTQEDALQYVGKTDGAGGRELSDAERQQLAANIHEAARANVAWRETRPVTDQIAMLAVPVVTVPPESEPED